jgi:hypothetical protein
MLEINEFRKVEKGMNLKKVEKLNNANKFKKEGGGRKKGTQEYGKNEKVEQYKSWAIDGPKHDKGEKVGQSMKVELVGKFGIKVGKLKEWISSRKIGT